MHYLKAILKVKKSTEKSFYKGLIRPQMPESLQTTSCNIFTTSSNTVLLLTPQAAVADRPGILRSSFAYDPAIFKHKST